MDIEGLKGGSIYSSCFSSKQGRIKLRGLENLPNFALKSLSLLDKNGSVIFFLELY